MNFNNQIDEAYLNQLCEALAKSQMTLMNEKTDDPEKQVAITKQLTAMNSLLASAMRLRNVLRKLKK
jgi:hypothetical protein